MTQQEVIKTFMSTLKNNTTLSGRTAIDAAVKSCSPFESYEDLINKFYDDFMEEKNWHTFLVKKCGIIIDNADTGAITGSDAGGTEKTKDTIIPSKGKAKYPEGSSFTIKGLTIYGIPPKETLSEAQQYVVKGLYSWWIRDSLELIEKSYGLSFDENANNTRIKLEFMNDPNDKGLAYCSYSDPTDGRDYEARTMTVNLALFENMDLTSRHGSSESSDTNSNAMQLDRTIVHELVHGVMATNIPYFADFPHFLSEGGTAELVHGIDDERRKNIIAYTQDKTFEPFRKSFRLESAGFNLPYEAYSCGYILMRYLAKQSAEDTTFDYDTYRENISIGSKGGFEVNYYDEVTMTGGKGSDTIENSGQNVDIKTAGGADYVHNYNNNVSIQTGAGKDSIHNISNYVNADGGAGADNISNEGDYSYIFGGADADYIVNSPDAYVTLDSATKTLFDATTSIEDDFMISLSNGTTLKVSTVSLEGGAHSTLYGGAGNDSLINYSPIVQIHGDNGLDYIGNSGNNATVYGGNGDDNIVNGEATLAVSDANVLVTGYKARIYGEDGNDSISNAATDVIIWGEADKDTISNSSSNVTVYGGDDEDYLYNTAKTVRLYGNDGNDTIVNESVADSVTAIGGAGDDVITNQGKNSVINGGEGADYISNYADFSSMLGGAGDDTIYNSGEKVTIKAGISADYVKNEGASDYINLGGGDDTIANEGDHTTIIGGKGDDYINNSGGNHLTYRFGRGAGKDVVVGANDGDTLRITSGTYSTVASGGNLTVYVGDDSITFQDLGSNKIVISRGSKNVSVSASPLFAEDENNFSELDSIIDNSLTVAEFENYSSEKISVENIITYAK